MKDNCWTFGFMASHKYLQHYFKICAACRALVSFASLFAQTLTATVQRTALADLITQRLCHTGTDRQAPGVLTKFALQQAAYCHPRPVFTTTCLTSPC
jgi:hypothetical protein